MSFVKLDTGILHSTLWVERDLREVFITALLMAQPYEMKEPISQIAVRSLEDTGFVVPPGWYGFVRAAGIGIINQAQVEIEEGMKALEKLGSPDQESRTPDFGGRRMVRVSGGYLILNYMKYRDMDHGAAERMRKLRQRRKGERYSNGVTVRPNVTHSREQIAEADAIKQNPASLDASVSHCMMESGLAGRKIRDVVKEVLRRESEKVGVDLKDAAEAMAAAWLRYDLLNLPFKCGPENFFGRGLWRKPESEWGDNGTSKNDQRIRKNREAILSGLGLIDDAGPGEPCVPTGDAAGGDSSVASGLARTKA